MRNNEQRVLFLGFEALLSPIRLFATSCRVLVFSIVNIRLHGREITNQMFESAVLSLPIILFSLTIVSLMSILEFSWHMKLVLKQDALVPGFSMVLMVREVAPVVTAMLLTSRVGASIAAELGFMKVTEQLDQLKLLSVSEVEYLVIPRWVGCVFASITLTLASLVTSICVSTGIASRFMNYQPHEFFNTLFVFTKAFDLGGGLLKAFCFGTIIPFVSCVCGLSCQGGSRGVGQAATRAVVQSCLFIIFADFFLSYWLWTF